MNRYIADIKLIAWILSCWMKVVMRRTWRRLILKALPCHCHAYFSRDGRCAESWLAFSILKHQMLTDNQYYRCKLPLGWIPVGPGARIRTNLLQSAVLPPGLKIQRFCGRKIKQMKFSRKISLTRNLWIHHRALPILLRKELPQLPIPNLINIPFQEKNRPWDGRIK